MKGGSRRVLGRLSSGMSRIRRLGWRGRICRRSREGEPLSGMLELPRIFFFFFLPFACLLSWKKSQMSSRDVSEGKKSPGKGTNHP